MRVLGWVFMLVGLAAELTLLTRERVLAGPEQLAVALALVCVLVGYRLVAGPTAFDWLLGVDTAPPYDQERDEPEHETLGPAFDFHRHRGRY